MILHAFLGIQPLPFEFGNKSSFWKKNLQNWENTGLFWIGKQPVFGSKIGKIKSLHVDVTVWIMISWLLMKPADLYLHCFKEGISFLKSYSTVLLLDQIRYMVI